MRKTRTAIWTMLLGLGQHPQARASHTTFRQGRLVLDAWLPYFRHPESRSSKRPVCWAPLLELTAEWLQRPSEAEAEVVRGRGTCQTAHRPLSVLGEIIVAAWGMLTSWRKVWTDKKLRAFDRNGEPGGQPSLADSDRAHGQQSLRIAYVGPIPQQGAGGPSGCAWLILEQLARSGVRLDCYLTFINDRDQLDPIAKWPEARVISVGSAWRWNRWYSRGPLMTMVTGLGTQAVGRRRLVNLLVEQHALVPYDAVYHFSTIEVFGRRKDRKRLPPIVLHPSVHAAGELRWLRKERHLSLRCEGWARPQLVIGWFWFRCRRQRKDIRRAVVVLAVERGIRPPPCRGLRCRAGAGADRPEPDRSRGLPSFVAAHPFGCEAAGDRDGRPSVGSQRGRAHRPALA